VQCMQQPNSALLITFRTARGQPAPASVLMTLRVQSLASVERAGARRSSCRYSRYQVVWFPAFLCELVGM